MSDSAVDAARDLAAIKEHIIIISKHVTAPPPAFNVGTEAAKAIAMAFSFILALALNAFLTLVFAEIPIGDGIFGAGIYAVIALVVCLVMMFIIYAYLEPWLRKKFEPKIKKQ